MVERNRRRIPDATVARLPVYLRLLYEVLAEGVANVSSERLAELAGVNAAKVRKDLSYLGSYGTRGVGYDVEYLVYQMSRELGLHREPVRVGHDAEVTNVKLPHGKGKTRRSRRTRSSSFHVARCAESTQSVDAAQVTTRTETTLRDLRALRVLRVPVGATPDLDRSSRSSSSDPP